MSQNSNPPEKAHSLWARVGAMLIDTIIMVLLFLAGYVIIDFLVGDQINSPATAPVVFFVIALFSLYAYNVVLEGWWGGQTVGKRLLDLKVTTENGGAITLRQAAIRNAPFLILCVLLAIPILGPLLFLMGFGTYLLVGFLAIRESETNQRFFDRYAGTVVTKT